MPENMITSRKQARVVDTIVKGGLYDYTFFCPHCGLEYTHHYGVEIFDRDDEDSETGRHVTVRNKRAFIESNVQEGNPSCRRDGILIHFYCESCNAISTLSIVQHKGRTYFKTTFRLTNQESEVASRTELFNK
jgi:hypothetical protein